MIRSSILAIVFVLAASAAGAQTDPLDRADSLAGKFEYAKAIGAYRSAGSEKEFRTLSGLSHAENMLGMDLLAMRDRDGAEAHFQRAIDAAERMGELYPDSASTHFNLAGAYGNLALVKGAKAKVRLGRDVERYAQRALEIDSTHSDALTVLGVFYREVAILSWMERLVARTLFGGIPSGSLETSESYLRRAIEHDPASAWAMYELGQTLIEMDRPEEARGAFQRLAGLEPRNSQDLRNMAEASAWLAGRVKP
ncbi:MAG TPA: tetratricopeptide repeat protein [Rhodothermia bacterium]|nr:tetratricopeptide repeat protein [Rhodothermia bacterium]